MVLRIAIALVLLVGPLRSPRFAPVLNPSY